MDGAFFAGDCPDADVAGFQRRIAGSPGAYDGAGANLGGTIAPLVSTLRDAPAAVRVPVGNMMMRAVGVFIAVPFVPVVIPWLEHLSADPARLLL